MYLLVHVFTFAIFWGRCFHGVAPRRAFGIRTYTKGDTFLVDCVADIDGVVD